MNKAKQARLLAINAGRVAAGAVTLAAAASAHAALPAGVETAITGAGADLVTAGTAVVVAMIGFWAVRKVGQKLGFW